MIVFKMVSCSLKIIKAGMKHTNTSLLVYQKKYTKYLMYFVYHRNKVVFTLQRDSENGEFPIKTKSF